jgi:hypothetical protein
MLRQGIEKNKTVYWRGSYNRCIIDQYSYEQIKNQACMAIYPRPGIWLDAMHPASLVDPCFHHWSSTNPVDALSFGGKAVISFPPREEKRKKRRIK